MQATVLSHSLVKDSIEAKPVAGKHPLNPFTEFAKSSGASVVLLEVTNDISRAEIHRASVDFFYCLEGEIDFVTGGVLKDPFLREYEDGTINDLEVRAPSIEGGEVKSLSAGDMIWIPNGLPHSSRTDTYARLLVLKIPTQDVFPLKNILGLKK